MKPLLFAILIVLACTFCIANSNISKTDRMPSKFDQFDSSMVIHLYYGGGMHYSSENIYIRFDSCIRIDMDHGHDRVTKFAMTKELRTKVLSIMLINNAEYIKQSEKESFAHDKATKSICVELNKRKDFCVSSGSSTEIAEKSKVDFGNVWDELEKFSLEGGKK
jgi:hypothetical protein